MHTLKDTKYDLVIKGNAREVRPEGVGEAVSEYADLEAIERSAKEWLEGTDPTDGHLAADYFAAKIGPLVAIARAARSVANFTADFALHEALKKLEAL